MFENKRGSISNWRGKKPKMVVLGLDRCLVDCGGPSFVDLKPPFERDANEIYDSNDNLIRIAERTRQALQWIFDQEIPLCVLSSTPRPDIARSLIRDLELDSFFPSVSIGTELIETQLKSIKKNNNIEFDDMLYVDHISAQPQDREKMGLIAMGVDTILDLSCLQSAMELYHDNLP